jgi:hypothetical protein
MTSGPPPPIPQATAERFAKAFSAFVDAVWAAVAEAAGNPALSSTPALLAWQTKALPLLEQENASIQKAMALFLIGEERTLVRLAAEERGLAKNLDGFALNFAGEERAKTLDRLETAVVVAAYQLCQAAGVP